MKHLQTWLALAYCLLWGIGCRSTSIPGMLDGELNSSADEIAACRINNQLVFVRVTDTKEQLWETSRNNDGTWSAPRTSIFTNSILRGIGKPAVAQFDSQRYLVVFPAQRTPSNIDLAECFYENGTWSQPRWLDELNSPAWDSHPTLLRNGSVLVFSSDRAGGSGSKDLYVTQRTANGWSQARLITLSTSGDELTPALLADTTLLFARRRDTTRSDLQLYIAYQSEPLQWTAAVPLPEPINSTADEFAPVVWDTVVIFSSSRAGNYDLYVFPLCGPVLLRGRIYPSPTLATTDGIVSVASTNEIRTLSISDSDTFELHLTPAEHYLLQYRNACSSIRLSWDISAPCDPLHTTVLTVPIVLPTDSTEFELTVDSLFADGDHLPTTPEHQLASHLLLIYNLSGSTLPVNTLNTSLEKVSLQVAAYIEQLLRCAPSLTVLLTVEAAPPIRPMRYNGADIAEPTLGIAVPTGAVLSPSAAARLRAYAVVYHIRRALAERLPHSMYKRIIWQVGVLEEAGSPRQCRFRAGVASGFP